MIWKLCTIVGPELKTSNISFKKQPPYIIFSNIQPGNVVNSCLDTIVSFVITCLEIKKQMEELNLYELLKSYSSDIKIKDKMKNKLFKGVFKSLVASSSFLNGLLQLHHIVF